jgi:hypothetical protein
MHWSAACRNLVQSCRLAQVWRSARPSGNAGLLLSDLVHVHRPDSRSIEAVVHVTTDGSASARALASFVNPTEGVIHANISLPLYALGLHSRLSSFIILDVLFADLDLDNLQ